MKPQSRRKSTYLSGAAPEPPSDLVFDDKQRYQPLTPNERGWLWCETLKLWLGTWDGSIRREPPTGTCHWLRFYDRSRNLVLLPEEIAAREQQQALSERQRAERLAQRLRELGEDPDLV